ncbi:MAG: BsaWI family type II restriction enzyme [Bacteroidia bacterium]|nr:BsaWI family type II restriction enzyme [Bacteroidia bacterium]
MKTDYYDFCLTSYKNEYKRYIKQLEKEHDGKEISENISDEWDKLAQKSAIRATIIKGLREFENPSVSELWSSIYSVHLYVKSGVNNVETIQRVVSADQSWKKSSGHAFEEMVKELANIALSDTDIEVVLQRDLNNLIKSKELGNEPRDISWLKEQIKSNIFDLYCIVNTGDKKQCFGCVQCKTSIRDRVTRDREPSIHAMQSFFWSIIFVLDGDFLKLPKFTSMVNGGSEEFPNNGWHEMYVFSEDKTNNRIHPINVDFEIFKKHALQASNQWLKQRQWFNSDWKSN